MMVRLWSVTMATGLLFGGSAAAQTDEAARFWGQWRGPDATGVARHGDPPVEWSETLNVAWNLRGSRYLYKIAEP